MRWAAPCGDLATALADSVVDVAGVGLAVEVLADGEHQIARATELAERVLDATQGEASSRGDQEARTLTERCQERVAARFRSECAAGGDHARERPPPE